MERRQKQEHGGAGALGPSRPLRRGWTTGACAAAAARAAYEGWLTGKFPDPVAIGLPGGAQPNFRLALAERDEDEARAGIVKDAGDDPDVTHGALVISAVRPGPPRSGLSFRAGAGIGTVTRPGLPLAVGEPAINPGPRRMIAAALAEFDSAAAPPDLIITVSIPGGEALAAKTMNGRLGIVGGLSVLGTTGIVIPYSCSSWIHSIQRGIDVARAAGLTHVAAATGSTSEAAVARLHGLPEIALLDMGDFVGARFLASPWPAASANWQSSLPAISTSIPRAADSISVGSPIVSARPAHRQRASRPPVKLAAAASCWQSRRAPGLTMRNGSRVSSPSRHARSRSPPSPAPLRLTLRSSTAMGA